MQATTNYKKYLIITLALLLHLLILIILFVPESTRLLNLFPSTPDSIDSALKKDWAARQAPAPTVFYDPAQPEQPHETLAQTAQELQPDEQMNQAHEIPATEQQATEDETTQEELQAPVIPAEQISPKEMAPAAPEEKPRRRKVARKRIKNQNARAHDQQARKLNLSDIAHFFKEKIQDIPMGNMFMQGDISKMPPDHQIIFERYRTKVGLIIENVVNQHPCPVSNVPQNSPLKLYLELERSGKFTDLRVVQSTGIPAADDYCLFVYHEASKQFPPIPDCLDEKLFRGYLRLYYYNARAGERVTRGNLFSFQ